MKKNLLTIFLLAFSVILVAQEKPLQAPSKNLVKFKQVQQADGNEKNTVPIELTVTETFENSNGDILTLPDGVKLECGFNEAHENLKQKHPWLPSDDDFELWIKDKIKQSQNSNTGINYNLSGPRCNIMYIPYVVHIIHPDNPVNSTATAPGVNISSAQVQSQIDALNRAYRKMNFSRNDSPMWDNVAADFLIEFVPVTINPVSNAPLPEPGINRIDLIAEGFSTASWTSPVAVINYFDNTIKPATNWDTDQIFNIWIADFAQSTGLLGYAQFPEQSGLPGLPTSSTAETDGIVCDTFTFQYQPDDDGSFTGFFPAFNLGGTTIHEVGHWVGLRHIWGDGGCGVDDFVTDTPLQGGPTNGCPVGQDSCSADDLPDMIANFMDYSDDDCVNILTAGQKERSDVVFTLSPRRLSLLSSDYADYTPKQPYVLIEVEDLRKDLIEAEGCAPYTDYVIRPRLKDCTDLMGTITATISVNGSSTMTAGDDYEFPGGTSVTFTGSGPEVLDIPVRIFSDGVTEGVETLVFDITVNAGGTDAVLHPDPIYTQAIWEVDDADIPADPATVSLVNDDANIVLPPSCVGGDLTLTFNFDDWPEETSWEIVDGMSVVVASGGPYGSEPDQSTLDIPLNLPSGSYTLTVFDVWGDGIIQGGGYTLTDSSGEEAAAGGGNFGSSESSDFCVAGGTSFNGILQIDSTVNEIENCGDDYAEYLIAINLSACVSGEQDVTATVMVDPASTAMLGTDFEFPSGTSVTFNGEGEQTLTLPIRFFGDGIAEGNETLILNVEVDDPSIVTLGTLTSTITIIDSDVPALTLSANVSNVREAEYNCDSSSNTFEVTVTASGCPSTNAAEIELVVANGSVAMEGDDFNFIGVTTHTFNSGNIDTPIVFTIEVFDDGVVEGDEALWFDLQLVDPMSGSVTNAPFEVIIQDPIGVSGPSVTSLGNFDFENGILPDGWTMLTEIDNAPNGMVISGNTDLDGNALHISSDPEGSMAYDYVNGSSNNIYILSPAFIPDGPTPFDFMFQVEGEVGFFVYDAGLVGLVDAAVPMDDYAGLFGSAVGFYLFLEPSPTTLTDYAGAPQDLQEWYDAGGYDGPVRIMFGWQSDNSIVLNPPLAVDVVDTESVQVGNLIETNKMIGDERPSYPINAGDNTFYYNVQDNDIAMMINSSSDHDCSSGYVYQAGTGAQQFISEYPSEFAADKTFAVEAGSPNLDATLNVGLYYTEAEIAGWEAATGQSRDNIYMFKTYDYVLGTCYDNNVKLDITLDNFPGETTWEVINDGTGTIIASGGPYTSAGGTVSESWNLPDGDYSFNIYDEVGDGICCGFGDGSYTLSAGTEEIASGGAFGDSESVSFCTSSNKLDLCADYTDIEFAPVSITPYLNGYQLTAAFATGLSELTGFGISTIPSVTPAEFTAVQNFDQVDITFGNKYDESAIAYYEVSYVNPVTGEENTIEVVPANGSSTYTITHFFPEIGYNIYRLKMILKNGDSFYHCNDVAVQFVADRVLRLYPNPATTELNIVLADDRFKDIVGINIYDAQGQLVMQQDVDSDKGVLRWRLDVSALAPASYYVSIVSASSGERKAATFVKVN